MASARTADGGGAAASVPAIYYCGGTHVVRAAPGARAVVLGVSAAASVAVEAPAGARAFAAEYALSVPAGGPLTARLVASGFRGAAGTWAAVEDFAAAGRPAAWTRTGAEDGRGARVPVPEDCLVALAWRDARSDALRACVVARAGDDESPVGAALKDAAFDDRAPAARLLAAAGDPGLDARARTRLITAPGDPPRLRLCANRDMLRAFAVGWFGAQLSAMPCENEKVFSAFDRARSVLDDHW
ncbi:putative virion protein [Parapoxvirus red deer/HL953]|uniref:Putative virion protein n=1 Tax=Parapoxvirus red deer/HL953 TaxID=1579460 RepID=A0A0A7MC48_9POXV|nr:putative virion protein [Parapoxvirus red deer/HL953]AIZ77317.1 putative virion protein [Parapoxvirus red deer/HL953]